MRFAFAAACVSTVSLCIFSLSGCKPSADVETANKSMDVQVDVDADDDADVDADASSSQGDSFPFTFDANDVKGNPQSLAALEGKVVLVDIWGTWCPPCREEIPSFIKLQEKFGPQGFQMIGINYEGLPSEEESKEKVLAFMAENGINYPCILGDEETKALIPNFEGFPTTLFIDKTGVVRKKVVGLHPYEELEEAVTYLLSQ